MIQACFGTHAVGDSDIAYRRNEALDSSKPAMLSGRAEIELDIEYIIISTIIPRSDTNQVR